MKKLQGYGKQNPRLRERKKHQSLIRQKKERVSENEREVDRQNKEVERETEWEN